MRLRDLHPALAAIYRFEQHWCIRSNSADRPPLLRRHKIQQGDVPEIRTGGDRCPVLSSIARLIQGGAVGSDHPSLLHGEKVPGAASHGKQRGAAPSGASVVGGIDGEAGALSVQEGDRQQPFGRTEKHRRLGGDDSLQGRQRQGLRLPAHTPILRPVQPDGVLGCAGAAGDPARGGGGPAHARLVAHEW